MSMNIIFAVNTKMDDTVEYLTEVISRIEGVQSNISIRCNLKNFDSEDTERAERIAESLKMLNSRHRFMCELYLDLPYPHKKIRLHSPEEKIIKENELVVATVTPTKKNVFLDGTLTCKAGDVVCYGNGEGLFRVKENNNEFITLQAINNIQLLKNKSLSTGVNEITQFHQWQIEFLKRMAKSVEKISFMLSFSDNSASVINFRNQVAADIPNARVFSKIESMLGIEKIDEIVEQSDGIVVARGDLFLSTKKENFLQNMIAIAKHTIQGGKHLIFATDILKSLNTQNFPLRSEVVDYQIIKLCGADSVILDSGILYRNRVDILKRILDVI